ncbi:hypothetical protein RJ641_005791, partial [Dillenia turbinata]
DGWRTLKWLRGLEEGWVLVIDGKGRLRVRQFRGGPISTTDLMVSPRGLGSSELISPTLPSSSSLPALQSPFSGLVICVTGLSKEARKQVKDATERLGGQYSPNLHPSFCGRKFEHALKYGSRKGLLIVTIGWFIDSVGGNVRLSESRYNIKNAGGINMHMDGSSSLFGFNGIENSYLPADVNENTKQCDIIKEPNMWLPMEGSKSFTRSALSGYSIYVDPDLSLELHSKVVEAAACEGAQFVDQWFVGCSASHVVCEGPVISRYLGHSDNVVTPLWILKTAREKSMHKLVHLSADIARQIGSMLENFKCGFPAEHKVDPVIHEDSCHQDDWNHAKNKEGCEERQHVVTLAKAGIRGRCARRMQEKKNFLHSQKSTKMVHSEKNLAENMSLIEVEAAIHTDSRHADRLRSVYSSKEAIGFGMAFVYDVYNPTELEEEHAGKEIDKSIKGSKGRKDKS